MNLNEKRAELRRRHEAVNKKVSRIRKSTGVELTGTQFDPRKPLANTKRMTGKQLDAQLARLNGFLDRGNQFVGDMNNRPIPVKEWRAYKSFENTYNANVLREFDKVRNIQLPNTDMTVDQRMAMKTNPKARGMNTDGDMTPYKPRALKPDQIVDRSALQKLTRSMKRQSRPGYLRARDRINKENLYGKLAAVGSRELYDAIRSLNGHQFRTMFLFSNFGEDFSMLSGRLRELEVSSQNETDEDRMLDDSSQQQYENALEGMLSVVKWAQGIQSPAQAKKPRRSGGRKRR